MSTVHEVCTTEEHDAGCTTDSRLAGRVVRGGVVYANETTTVTCHDCGATTSFEHEVLMGFEGEPGV